MDVVKSMQKTEENNTPCISTEQDIILKIKNNNLFLYSHEKNFT